MTRRPNIVFVMPDQWRASVFGHAGDPAARTPNVDALASRGVVFSSAYCDSPVCQPSRASLITGRYVADHGLRDNEHIPWAAGTIFPDPKVDTMMRRLQRAGYHTAEVGKMHFTGLGLLDLLQRGEDDSRTIAPTTAAYGFDEVYEEFDKAVLSKLRSNYTDMLADKGVLDDWRDHVRRTSVLAGEGPALPEPEELAPEDTLDAFIGRRAADWLRNYDRADPFFLWVAPIGPHPPYDAPQPYSDRFEPDGLPLPLVPRPAPAGTRWDEFQDWNIDHLRCGDYTEDDWRRTAASYYGNCALVDELVVGPVLQALESTGLDADTWIVFTSDHGELLGDHELLGKRLFHGSSVRVPLVISPPGGLPSPLTVDATVQGVDVTATILDIAHADGSGLSGHSLVGAVDGEPVGRPVVFSEIAEFLMVATSRHKLILHEPTLTPQSLFDLELDPQERADRLKELKYASVVNEVSHHARAFVAGSR